MPWASVKTLAVCRDWVAQHGSPLNLLFLNIFALRIIMSYATVFFSFLYLVATSKMPVGVTHFRTTKAECRKKHHCLHLRFYFPLPVFSSLPNKPALCSFSSQLSGLLLARIFAREECPKRARKRPSKIIQQLLGNTVVLHFWRFCASVQSVQMHRSR